MRRNAIKGARLGSAVLVTAALLALVSCGGSNLFTVQGQAGSAAGEDTQAPTVTIESPRGDSLSARPVGDSVFVQAHVKDNVGVHTVRFYGVAHRGSKDLGTDTVVQRFVEKDITLPAGVVDTTIMRYIQPTADSTREIVQIVVAASDSSGNEAADSAALLVGGPDVQLLDVTNGQSVQAGLNLTVRVRAQDPLGINRIGLAVTGAFSTTIEKSVNPAADSIVLDTVIAIPSSARGAISVTASARNSLDVTGQDGPDTLNVIAGGVGDTIAPHMKETATAPDRMELQDTVLLQVSGADNTQGSGVQKVGYTVLAISARRGDTLVHTDSAVFSPARTGTVSKAFAFRPFNVDSLNLPDTLVFEMTSWMVDAAGNCAASSTQDSTAAYVCGTQSGARVAVDRPGLRLQRSVVAGMTVQLPNGGQIMDAAVDTMPGRRKLYLSNITQNRLDVFDLETDKFDNAIGVGSEPWGLAFSRSGDSLWVANSGGTNLSVVDVATGREIDNDRFLTPDVHLFDIARRQGQTGSVLFLVTPYPQEKAPSFSDRPQFVAVDKYGNLIFSTKTTDIGNLGTARKAYYEPGWESPEAKIFVEQAQNTQTQDNWVVAHIDSLTSVQEVTPPDSLGVQDTISAVKFFDHQPGFPNQLDTTSLNILDPDPICDAAARLKAQGSDVYCQPNQTWNIPSLAFQDTTYVAASGDGEWVSIGEGGTSNAGRVLTYQAHQGDTTALTSWLQVSDLLTNSPEEVKGIGLNYDGTLEVVRGQQAAYFIDPKDLRVEGQTEIPNATVGGGAVLDPLHADARTLENLGGQYHPDTQLAFVATGDHTVDIIDTQRFTTIGRVYIRDNITGPLRAVLPFPSDNTGLTCGTIPVHDRYGNLIGNAIQLYNGEDFNSPIAPHGSTDDRCVVVKLFAPTSGGGVVAINVRKADILRDHPARR